MTGTTELAIEFAPATDGEIAVINFESARRQSWSRFWRDPQRPGIAETILEQEQMALQFLGDIAAIDRVETLVDQLTRTNTEPARLALVSAQFASMTHRFAEARNYLAPLADVERVLLSIDQACGTNLDTVLETRRRNAASGRLEDLVPLGALLADLRDFEAADRTYDQALRQYNDVSPFALTWVCFQRGVLWGELVPDPHPALAARWYRKAIEYLPAYVKARVHLAEIYLRSGQLADAEALLLPVASTGDPEVSWRLADVLKASGRDAESEAHMRAARSGFESLIEKHLLAFADHGAAFYSGSGNDPGKALQLAGINAANRPGREAPRA